MRYFNFLFFFFALLKTVCSLTLRFEHSLYIMDTRLLAYIRFANIFFQSVAYLFILFKVIFQRGEFFILMKSDLSVCSFINCAFDVISKKSLPKQHIFSYAFFWSFIVLGFTFNMDQSCLFVCLFLYGYPVVPEPFVGKTVTFQRNCQKSSVCICMGLFLDSILFLWSICHSWCKYHTVLIIIAL